MYVPSVGAFAIQDGIPFFLQITGCPSSLKLLSTRKTSPTKTSHVQVPHHHYPFPASESESKSEAEVGVRVTVLRQIAMNFGADLVPRHSTIGHAKLEAIPPALSQEENLNWQGTLKIDDSIKNGRFEAPHLAVHVSSRLGYLAISNAHSLCSRTSSYLKSPFQTVRLSKTDTQFVWVPTLGVRRLSLQDRGYEEQRAFLHDNKITILHMAS